MTGDEPQGTMGRVQTAGEARLARCFLPAFLARTFSSKERRLGTRQAKKCTEKCDARAKLLFCLLNLLFLFVCFFFLTFPLPSASLDLKVPNSKLWENTGHHKYFAIVCNNMTAYPDARLRLLRWSSTR